LGKRNSGYGDLHFCAIVGLDFEGLSAGVGIPTESGKVSVGLNILTVVAHGLASHQLALFMTLKQALDSSRTLVL
jgi:hypothetical protein